jgi:hypothetical protein
MLAIWACLGGVVAVLTISFIFDRERKSLLKNFANECGHKNFSTNPFTNGVGMVRLGRSMPEGYSRDRLRTIFWIQFGAWLGVVTLLFVASRVTTNLR